MRTVTAGVEIGLASREMAELAVPPTGRLWSLTVCEHELHPGFKPPYTVVVVVLDRPPATRLMGYLPGRPDLDIGMAMRATFEVLDDDTTLVQWQPTE